MTIEFKIKNYSFFSKSEQFYLSRSFKKFSIYILISANFKTVNLSNIAISKSKCFYFRIIVNVTPCKYLL